MLAILDDELKQNGEIILRTSINKQILETFLLLIQSIRGLHYMYKPYSKDHAMVKMDILFLGSLKRKWLIINRH